MDRRRAAIFGRARFCYALMALSNIHPILAGDGIRPSPVLSVSATRRTQMLFLRCLLMHYGIYRRYPWGGCPPCAAPLSPKARYKAVERTPAPGKKAADFGGQTKPDIAR
jgi:hypothetical protein